MSATVPTTRHWHGHVRAILRRRDFRRLLATRASSQLGDGFFQAGLAVSVFFNPSQQVEPYAYAVAFAMLVAPYSLLGPYVGVFLDRWSRRDILSWCNGSRALLVIPAAGLIVAQAPEATFGTLALAVISINRFVLAGLSAAQPHVVEKPHLITANSFATTLGTLSYGAGLGLSYLVIRAVESLPGPTLSYGVAALVAAPLYAIAALLTWRSYRVAALGPDESERATGSIAAAIAATTRGMIGGFAHLWRRRGAAYIMTVQAGHRALYGVLAVLTLAVFRGYFHDPALAHYQDTLAWLAAIAAAGQAGSFLAAVVTPRVSRWLGPAGWVLILLTGLMLALCLLGLNMIEELFVVATCYVNVVSQSTKIVVDTSLQSTVDDDYRGRLFSLNDTVFNVAFIIGMFGGAALLPADGMAPYLLYTTAGGYVLLTTWYRWVSPRHPPYQPM